MVAMWAFCIEALIRGIDYFTGDRTDVTQSLTVVEAALPIQAWGALLITGSVTFLFGIVRRRHGPIITGSVLLMAVYGALAAGMAIAMVGRGWPWDGYRTPLMFVVIAILFGLYAFSTYLKRSAWIAEQRMSGEG
ncbi:hypothetical protein [Corynebacterium sp. A21]|uniref:hypothetical protein n=1 Tax=Corynebacterium sp. A21 TaxID=3457318 RepID=UPI003FD1BD55